MQRLDFVADTTWPLGKVRPGTPPAPAPPDGKRDTNHRSTATYLKRIESGADPTAESDSISQEDSARERAAFGVRMIDGIDLNEIHAATGFDLRQACAEVIQSSIDEGMLDDQGDRIRLTEKGILFADMIAARFLG